MYPKKSNGDLQSISAMIAELENIPAGPSLTRDADADRTLLEVEAQLNALALNNMPSQSVLQSASVKIAPNGSNDNRYPKHSLGHRLDDSPARYPLRLSAPVPMIPPRSPLPPPVQQNITPEEAANAYKPANLAANAYIPSGIGLGFATGSSSTLPPPQPQTQKSIPIGVARAPNTHMYSHQTPSHTPARAHHKNTVATVNTPHTPSAPMDETVASLLHSVDLLVSDGADMGRVALNHSSRASLPDTSRDGTLPMMNVTTAVLEAFHSAPLPSLPVATPMKLNSTNSVATAGTDISKPEMQSPVQPRYPDLQGSPVSGITQSGISTPIAPSQRAIHLDSSPLSASPQLATPLHDEEAIVKAAVARVQSTKKQSQHPDRDLSQYPQSDSLLFDEVFATPRPDKRATGTCTLQGTGMVAEVKTANGSVAMTFDLSAPQSHEDAVLLEAVTLPGCKRSGFDDADVISAPRSSSTQTYASEARNPPRTRTEQNEVKTLSATPTSERNPRSVSVDDDNAVNNAVVNTSMASPAPLSPTSDGVPRHVLAALDTSTVCSSTSIGRRMQALKRNVHTRMLRQACREGNTDKVLQLLALKADVNAIVTDAMTLDDVPLVQALRRTDYEMARILLRCGAAPAILVESEEYEAYLRKMQRISGIVYEAERAEKQALEYRCQCGSKVKQCEEVEEDAEGDGEDVCEYCSGVSNDDADGSEANMGEEEEMDEEERDCEGLFEDAVGNDDDDGDDEDREDKDEERAHVFGAEDALTIEEATMQGYEVVVDENEVQDDDLEYGNADLSTAFDVTHHGHDGDDMNMLDSTRLSVSVSDVNNISVTDITTPTASVYRHCHANTHTPAEFTLATPTSSLLTSCNATDNLSPTNEGQKSVLSPGISLVSTPTASSMTSPSWGRMQVVPGVRLHFSAGVGTANGGNNSEIAESEPAIGESNADAMSNNAEENDELTELYSPVSPVASRNTRRRTLGTGSALGHGASNLYSPSTSMKDAVPANRMLSPIGIGRGFTSPTNRKDGRSDVRYGNIQTQHNDGSTPIKIISTPVPLAKTRPRTQMKRSCPSCTTDAAGGPTPRKEQQPKRLKHKKTALVAPARTRLLVHVLSIDNLVAPRETTIQALVPQILAANGNVLTNTNALPAPRVFLSPQLLDLLLAHGANPYVSIRYNNQRTSLVKYYVENLFKEHIEILKKYNVNLQ